MKKFLFVAMLAAMGVGFMGCGDDDEDEEPAVKCLICDGSTEQLCEGDTDPDSGQTVTLELLELSRDLANALGANCRVE